MTTASLGVYTLLVLAGGVGAVGDAFLNRWVTTDKLVWLVVSFVLWVLAVTCFALLLKYQVFPFGAAVVLALLVHSALAVLFDRWYFGGRLTLCQWIGICCALVAIVPVGQGASSAPSLHPIQEASVP